MLYLPHELSFLPYTLPAFVPRVQFSSVESASPSLLVAVWEDLSGKTHYPFWQILNTDPSPSVWQLLL